MTVTSVAHPADTLEKTQLPTVPAPPQTHLFPAARHYQAAQPYAVPKAAPSTRSLAWAPLTSSGGTGHVLQSASSLYNER